MKTNGYLSLTLMALLAVSARAQPDPIILDTFDGFSLAWEVVRNKNLRSFLKVSDATTEKIRSFLQDPVNEAIRRRIDSLQAFGHLRKGSTDSITKLEASLTVRMQTAVPEYNANDARTWALKKMFLAPETAFTSPKVHQYLDLDRAAIKLLQDTLLAERVSFEELRNGFRRDRAKAILEDLPVGAQVLFARYAGSEILDKFEQVAEQEGPLEFICYGIDWTNTIVQLTRNPILHKRLQLSPEQLEKICFIDVAMDQQIFAVDRRKLSNGNEEVALVQRKSFKEAFSLLTETQNRRLQQWVASEFFLANPKRELSRDDLRNYLGLNIKEDWNRTLQLIEERDSRLEKQIAQLNALVVAKLLSVLPAKYNETASQLFKGVW